MYPESIAPEGTNVDVTVLFNQAMAAIGVNQMDEAKDLLLQVVHLNPEHEQAWFWLAGAVTEVSQTIECIRRVLALNPDNTVAREWLAVALQSSGDAEEATNQTRETERPVQRLGRYLLEHGFVTAEQIDAALIAQAEETQAGRRSRIGELLIQQGAISEEQLKIALRDQEQDFFSLFMD